VRFLKWVESARLAPKTKTYYQDGWRLLETTSILKLRLDAIDNDVAEQLSFSGSAANANCALRTLRRLLHKAEDWKLIRRAPKIGSERESVKMRILRGFLQSDEFVLGGRQALRLQQQVVHVAISSAAAQQSLDVAVDGFDHAHRYLGSAVVQDTLEVIQ